MQPLIPKAEQSFDPIEPTGLEWDVRDMLASFIEGYIEGTLESFPPELDLFAAPSPLTIKLYLPGFSESGAEWSTSFAILVEDVLLNNDSTLSELKAMEVELERLARRVRSKRTHQKGGVQWKPMKAHQSERA